MTFNDPRILDLTAFDGHDDRRHRNGGNLHTLRLALDLQLDAMLVTLGAAAHSATRPVAEQDEVPWRRWLVEDLELARTLAVALVEGEAAPAPGLGGGITSAGIEMSLEHLVARFTSMERLLVGVLERPNGSESWRGAAAEALARCRSRLEELHEHRRGVIVASVSPAGFLPGELLG